MCKSRDGQNFAINPHEERVYHKWEHKLGVSNVHLSEVQKFHYQSKPIGSDGMESTEIIFQKGFRGLTRPCLEHWSQCVHKRTSYLDALVGPGAFNVIRLWRPKSWASPRVQRGSNAADHLYLPYTTAGYNGTTLWKASTR